MGSTHPFVALVDFKILKIKFVIGYIFKDNLLLIEHPPHQGGREGLSKCLGGNMFKRKI